MKYSRALKCILMFSLKYPKLTYELSYKYFGVCQKGLNLSALIHINFFKICQKLTPKNLLNICCFQWNIIGKKEWLQWKVHVDFLFLSLVINTCWACWDKGRVSNYKSSIFSCLWMNIVNCRWHQSEGTTKAELCGEERKATIEWKIHICRC